MITLYGARKWIQARAKGRDSPLPFADETIAFVQFKFAQCVQDIKDSPLGSASRRIY